MVLKRKKQREFGDIDTIISHRLTIEGNLHGEGSIRADGIIEGDVDLRGDLIIGDKGTIKGNIQADNVLIAGRVEGSINARGRAEILASGEVQGDITCQALVIEEGGCFTGTSRMLRGTNKEKTGTKTDS
ncbi:MAG: polymer-forming cytoskeletal protein [Syntrophothermus sp.]|uniref:bactofilin family protein n=1 Tax=Syntrophothermus sp. TaxID=2736299 RepID=UPI00257AF1ED|nr:polymer-forming cytoskeletal protein [Syntrophothermus sp.]NSW84594.1 polymer-forming cytoskeletal protein [Syntrophothermus sp.]